MSADNWGICPRCNATKRAEYVRREKAVTAAYGAVSVAEFDAMRADLKAFDDEPVKQTLREDYEVGLDEDGEFYVIYKGHCRECGLSHEFRHEERVS